MAQKLTYICDLCQTQEVEAPAPHRAAVTIEAGKFFIDLCDDCHKGWWEPFAARVAHIGQAVKANEKVKAPPATHYERKELLCPVCGELFHDYGRRTQHMMDEHPDAMHKCPEPDCGQLVMPNSQGMIMHYVRSHPGLDYPNND